MEHTSKIKTVEMLIINNDLFIFLDLMLNMIAINEITHEIKATKFWMMIIKISANVEWLFATLTKKIIIGIIAIVKSI